MATVTVQTGAVMDGARLDRHRLDAWIRLFGLQPEAHHIGGPYIGTLPGHRFVAQVDINGLPHSAVDVSTREKYTQFCQEWQGHAGARIQFYRIAWTS